MRRRALLMGGKSEPNTIIGGVGSVITTKSALATKLGISESIIRGFEVVGNDVHCRISQPYNIPQGAFSSEPLITSYHDYEGMVSEIGGTAFNNCINLNSVTFYQVSLGNYCFNGSGGLNDWTGSLAGYVGQYALGSVPATPDLSLVTFVDNNGLRGSSYTGVLPLNLVNHIGSNSFFGLSFTEVHLNSLVNVTSSIGVFQSCAFADIIEMKKLKTWGVYAAGGTATQMGFGGLKMGCIIRTNEAMATANAGNPHEAFLYAKNTRGATVEFYDDDGNYVSTL